MTRLEQSVLISILDWSPLVNVSADTGLQQIFYWTKRFLKYQTGFCLFLYGKDIIFVVNFYANRLQSTIKFLL